MVKSILAQSVTPAYSADDVLSPYVYVFYVAFLVSLVFTPIMRRVATFYNIIDRPDNLRKMHRTPVAYLGGVAVFLGWICGLAASQFVPMHRVAPGLDDHVVIPWSIVVGASVIVVLGLLDDILHIQPWQKIAGQVFAALLLLVNGVGSNIGMAIWRPVMLKLYAQTGWPVDGWPPEWLLVATNVTVVTGVIVFCCNATNLMDGLDGLCGGVTAIVAAGYAFLAVHLAMWGDGAGANWDAARVVLALALLAAVLAFVPYNFNPASIFMGDTGSMFLGFTCGLMIILVAEVENKWFLASLVMFSLPVLDTSLAFARRYVNRRPIFSADKHHLHHQLVARGLSVKQAVVLSYALAIGFVLLGAVIVFLRTRYALMAYLVIFGSIIVAAYKMGMVHERPTVVKPKSIEGNDLIKTSDEPTGVLEIRGEAPDATAGGQAEGPRPSVVAS
ncbi:MAG: undecaprenyl/decaprenyl-phosphate alpha-N-acetylglucosaminyl 1-phosphate transferase, partial [Phycisphaerae bacterium]|nr:undecaprenyl/decaprenyl-phosphate alpha-N-acetylglucosaminyl 1-phosphate transferase [Phycisphaerae bacterium]MDW8263299.1 MraY family glycosyltransferase [Phycisphaerales bacterium]